MQYVGIDAVRVVCGAALETSGEAVSWTVPDLHVLAGGDVAVAWGLNRMQADGPDGDVVEFWSRGTRIFHQADGAWKMVHQHVSYPFDPESGRAAPDLRP